MLLHLPIAILATLSPVAVSDTVPKFDIVRECRFEGGSTVEFDRCSEDEDAALRQLEKEWTQFAGIDRRNCISTATTGGVASYVELLTCLEMARDVASPKAGPNDSLPNSGLWPKKAGRSDITVGEAHRH